MGECLFSFPKPVSLLQLIISGMMPENTDSIFLDFFAGSGSLAHAVWLQNIEDKGTRRVFLVQLPETIENEDLSKKYKHIANITKERLRMTGAMLRRKSKEISGDLGFRVFKLDSSNIATWEPRRHDLAGSIQEHIDHLKPGRTQEDLLFEIMLKYGLDLAAPISVADIAGFQVHRLGGGILSMCLADGISADRAEALGQGLLADLTAQGVPLGDAQLVFKDHGFVDDVAKANLMAILAQGGIKDDYVKTL
jgi:adenine-specific DNA-methyltransferase